MLTHANHHRCYSESQKALNFSFDVSNLFLSPFDGSLIPWTDQHGRLQSTGSVRHDWATSLSLFTFHFHFRNCTFQFLNVHMDLVLLPVLCQNSTSMYTVCTGILISESDGSNVWSCRGSVLVIVLSLHGQAFFTIYQILSLKTAGII